MNFQTTDTNRGVQCTHLIIRCPTYAKYFLTQTRERSVLLPKIHKYSLRTRLLVNLGIETASGDRICEKTVANRICFQRTKLWQVFRPKQSNPLKTKTWYIVNILSKCAFTAGWKSRDYMSNRQLFTSKRGLLTPSCVSFVLMSRGLCALKSFIILLSNHIII